MRKIDLFDLDFCGINSCTNANQVFVCLPILPWGNITLYTKDFEERRILFGPINFLYG
jgi:hypothetical protein